MMGFVEILNDKEVNVLSAMRTQGDSSLKNNISQHINK